MAALWAIFRMSLRQHHRSSGDLCCVIKVIQPPILSFLSISCYGSLQHLKGFWSFKWEREREGGSEERKEKRIKEGGKQRHRRKRDTLTPLCGLQATTENSRPPDQPMAGGSISTLAFFFFFTLP